MFFRNLLLFVVIFSLNLAFAQSITPDYLRNLKVSDLTDDKVKNIKEEMDLKGISMSTLETLAIANGMSVTDFSILKTRLESYTPAAVQTNVDQGTNITEKPIEMDANSSIKKSDIFGSQIFNNSSLSFEPNPNLVTPPTYVLGSGDELMVVIFGMQELSTNCYVSKEGKISIPFIGQIYVNGLTFDAAKSVIKKACSKVYSSLASGKSSISITLTKIRTINITLLGVTKPGNYSVSSLATVFNALHIAGGPDANGTYRKIELIRNNKVVRTIDVYKFLTSGDLSENVSLMDNDVIRVPVYEHRVQIEGNVRISGIFELLPSENFMDLLKYCSGFTESAYRSNIKLVQNTDKELKIIDLSESEYKNYRPKSGDILKVSSILNRFENKIAIKGAVYRPDDYALTDGMTVKDLIDKADGLTNDAYMTNAQLIREKQDLTKEFISLDLQAIMNGSKNITLQKNDEIIVSSIFELKNQQHVSITGQIKKPGDFPYLPNLTLYDLILQAGGFTDKASKHVEISSVIIKDEIIKDQIALSSVKMWEIDTLLKDQSKNIILNPFDIVQIRKKPIYEDQSFISITGQVQYPGNYVLSNKNERFSQFIERAGGLGSDANTKAIYILRKTDRITSDRVEHIERKIPIDFKKVMKKPGSSKNVVMKSGDEIVVSKIDPTVKVIGNVYLNSEIPFASGKRLKYYISAVGGFNEDTDKKRIYVVYPNGLGRSTKRFLFIKNYPRIQEGCEIVVPVKPKDTDNNKGLSISEMSIITGVIGSLAGITIAIINLLSK